MQSDSGIIYCEPPKPLWVPRSFATKPTGLGVRYQTEVCDIDGRFDVSDPRHIKRATVTHQGVNMLTDWGMDALATLRADQLVNYLHLSDTLGTSKRVLSGGTTLSLVITSATSITVTASANFFIAGDVGKTLSINDLGGAGRTQELKITGYTSALVVTCSTRPGAWLPGFTAGTGPFSSAGVHATDTSTLANQTQKFNTYDTSAANNNAELNDSSNSRWIHQRIFLSATVTGTAWTINQLGWSDGNGSNNCFGWSNLASPDTVDVGKKYRVTLQLFSAYTPIDIASQSVNWGATIGTYTLAIRSERIGKDSNTAAGGTTPYNWLQPKLEPADSNFRSAWWTSAFTIASILWEGDAGFSTTPHGSNAGRGASGSIVTGAYTSGQHTRVRSVRWDDSVAITSATGLGVVNGNATTSPQMLGLKPSSGTITKPSGYWCQLDFQLYWTRAFVN